jgi:hypothetical protein
MHLSCSTRPWTLGVRRHALSKVDAIGIADEVLNG